MGEVCLKVIFDEPILCAQFVRDYVDLPYMKDVRPEDIEDVSSQFVPLVPIRKYTNEELLERADEISLVMLFNKLQNKEDVTELRKISPGKLEKILQDSPGQVVKVIADVLFTFLVKANVPVEEAEELVGKVKEKKMAELFADMEKMDIQAERRNTAEQRARADKEKERADKAEERADKAEERADKAEAAIENGIRLFIEMCREFVLSREQTLQRLAEKYGIECSEAEEWLEKYWAE